MLERGKLQRQREIGPVRELTKADLPALMEQRHPAQRLQKIRESHRMVARLIASGLSCGQVAAKTGRNTNSITLLAKDPSVMNLVAEYRAQIDEVFVENMDAYVTTATANMLRAEQQISDKLEEAEEAGESLPVRDLIAISRDAADRFGYGKHSSKTVNHDFAALLDKAMARSAQAKVVNASHVTTSASGSLNRDSSPRPEITVGSSTHANGSVSSQGVVFTGPGESRPSIAEILKGRVRGDLDSAPTTPLPVARQGDGPGGEER